MAKIYKDVSELIGNTPLLELNNLKKSLNYNANILAKLEYFNPAGSAKDRVALAMILEAEKSGKLNKDSVIVEPTSGNTGIGLAAVAAAKGYRVIIVMPSTMSAERRMLVKAYGAKLVLSDGAKGMSGAIETAEQIVASTPNSFIAGQFVNPANTLAHKSTTGPEIYEDTCGNVDVFVAGVGTGGTITGVAEYLKGKNPAVKIVGVEPETSAVLSGKPAGSHGLQGIGAGFVPEILNTKILGEVITVSDADAYEYSRKIAKTEGVLVGISSGAALCAAVKIAKRPENSGKNIVVLLPDTGERYLSTELFAQ